MTFDFGGLKIDPVAYGSSGNAILGIRDSGKTYTATAIAERLFDAGIPFIAFDPVGVWRFLRRPRLKGGKGYPIVVAGGQDGDIPLTPVSAPLVIGAAMDHGISLVLDLFDMELTKSDWKRIVKDGVRLLLHKNKAHGLRHVFIEEASEFVPQVVRFDGDVYAEVEKLARMGGNSRLGYTLINQRAEEVNKAVLELCDNLFLHRQKGRNSLKALTKWLEIGNVRDSKPIVDSLSTLPSGECWAWMAGQDHAVRIKVPEKASLHPDRRVMREDVEASAELPKAVDAGSFIELMRKSLPAVAAPPSAPPRPKAAAPVIKVATDQAFAEGYAAGVKAGEQAIRSAALKAFGQLRHDVTAAESAVNAARAPQKAPHGDRPNPSPISRAKANGQPTAAPSGLTKGPAKLLTALARQHPAKLTQAQWATLAVMRRTGGTWRTYVSKLRVDGLIAQEGNLFGLTAAGVAASGDAIGRHSNGDTKEMWKRSLGSGPAKMIEALADHYPEEITRQDLADETSFEITGGTFRTYLSKLVANGLARVEGNRVAATDTLFL